MGLSEIFVCAVKMFQFIALLVCLSGIEAARVSRAYTCGGQDYLTSNNGVVNSHTGLSAGHNYGKNMNCVWRIEAPQGSYVELVAQSFNVEPDSACQFDWLELFDGDGTNAPSLGKFCGSRFNPISSTGRILTLQFVTDDDTQLSGFALFYNFTTTIIHQCHSSEFQCANSKCVSSNFRCDNDDDCGDDSDEQNCGNITRPTGGPGGIGCHFDEFKCSTGDCVLRDWLCDGDDDCGDNSDENPTNCHSHGVTACVQRNQTGTSGVVTSPNYPNSYPNSAHCIFLISSPGAKSLALNFETPFHIEPDNTCSYDYVVVYGEGMTFKHGPFCGDQSPGALTIPSDHCYVEFDSDSSDAYTGFRVDWKANK